MRRKTAFIVGLAFVLGFIARHLFGADPSMEVRASLADSRQQRHQRTTRYFTTYNIPPDDRKAVVAVLNYELNAVSRARTIQYVREIPQGIAGPIDPKDATPTLYAIDLQQLGIDPKFWEALVSDNEPYFHVPAKAVNPLTGKVEDSYTAAGHTGIADAESLRYITGSGGAVVRADWFIARLSKPPHYHIWAGIPATRAEFNKLFAVDDATIIALGANKGANILRSGVTLRERRVSRWQSPLGGYWVTYDSEENKDPKRDPFKTPGFDIEADASEHIAAKANGLHLFGLYNRKGQRQDTVPDKIAKHPDSPHGDGILVNFSSCVACHTNGGLQPFGNDMKTLLRGRVDLNLPAKDADELAAFYSTDKLAKQLPRDREDYDEAVQLAIGNDFKPGDLPKMFAKVISTYASDTVTQATAMRELGVDSLEALKFSTDPHILALVEGLEIQRSKWEVGFNEAMTLVKGVRR